MNKNGLPKWDQIKGLCWQAFEEAGITTCELQLPQCKFGLFQSLAHAKKVREWVVLEDCYDVIRTCNSCHQFIEALGKKKIITMDMVVHGTQEIRWQQPNFLFMEKYR